MIEIKLDDEVIRMFPLEGVTVWKNPKNRFTVFELHMDADPKKRDKDYKDVIRTSMPNRQYLQEYELQWDSFSGLPVYEDYREHIHGSKTRLHPKIGLPLLRGWDFGLTPACLIAQLQEQQLVILDEFCEFNMGIDKFTDKILPLIKSKYPEWNDARRDWKDFIDPSGFSREDTMMNSCARVLMDKGVRPIPGPVVWEERRQAVEFFLTRSHKGEPCFQLDLTHCPITARGFKGGYRYQDKMAEVESLNPRPIKDEHSHPHDALQYIAAGVKGMLKKHSYVRVPTPYYSFSSKKGS
jgi:hypothetical protein